MAANIESGPSDNAGPGIEENLPSTEAPSPNSESRLLQLPAELLQQILSELSVLDLTRVSRICRSLAEHTSNNLLWADLLNAHLPFKIHDPGPYASFRSLYAAYYPCWFIPRNKVWFADTEHTGNLILARYDNRRGVIEAYRVVAERRNHAFQIWEWNPDVIIQSFNPKVSLWLDDPVLFLKNTPSAEGPPRTPQYLSGETRMPMALEYHYIFNSFSLCSNKLPNREMAVDQKWPPPNIPSDQRVHRDMDEELSERDEPPRHVEDISEIAFRIRRWAHFRVGMPSFTAGDGETLTTFATLDPTLYTPTREKPYQGIWVGDYSAHGCEFLLFLQRDTADVSTASEEAENTEWIPHGRLEAIKLTGDPNVPRGEISFAAEDIGQGGFVRVANDSLFRNARVVRSDGHVAGLGFRDGKPEYSVHSGSTIADTYRYLVTFSAYSRIYRLCGPLLGIHGPCFIFPTCGYRRASSDLVMFS